MSHRAFVSTLCWDMTDRPTEEIETLLRLGEIERAAAVAKEHGMTRRAAELLALAGKHPDAVMLALESAHWQLALDLALASGDERIVAAVCEELGRDARVAHAAAAHARIARRNDVAARILELSDPEEAGRVWYECGEYARAAQCFDRAGQRDEAIRALEQHLTHTPDDVNAAERLAELRAARGDNEGAVRALQAAARAGAGTSVLKKLIDGLVRIGLQDSAQAVVRRLRKIEPEAPAELESYANALPRSQGQQERYAGRYRVVRQVGSGATGRVLEAVDELSGETVALKVLSVSDDRSGAFGRFVREAELARALDDPTLVRMRDFDPDGPTIVYDWMPGGTLAERIGKLTVPEVRTIASRILRALETLHRHGVVHRDLKPSNVLFDPAGQARLGDLGAAHLSDLGTTVTGGFVGSLPYMAPEQITGDAVSAATDLYAFGCLLYQMLTGVLPFPGPDYVTQHLSDPVPKVSSARPALGTAYDNVIAKLLAKDPGSRPADCAEVQRLLRQLPWVEPDDEQRTSERERVSSIPAPAREQLAPIVPSTRPGRWIDTRLGREIEIVRVPRAWRDHVTRWAAADRSELQPVYEVSTEGEDLLVWVEPLEGTPVQVERLPEQERKKLEDALRAAGIEPQDTVKALRTAWFGTIVLLREAIGIEQARSR